MIDSTNFSIEEFNFDSNIDRSAVSNRFTKELWPIVYILSDGRKKIAYVGETTDTIKRLKNHLAHDEKKKLTAVHLVSSDQFNKSATLDIESNLIKYMSADKQFNLLNANLGIANHNYYQKSEYWDLFTHIWSGLQSRGIAKKSLNYIENLNLFKYSPYKSLSVEQNEGLLAILRSLANDTYKHTMVEGVAGTGKSILAIFLFKLLMTSAEDLNFREFGENEKEIIDLVLKIKKRKGEMKMGLVVPVTSFRKTLKRVFSAINGLKGSMVIGPNDVTKEEFDLVLVDEAHRLDQRKNLSGLGSYDVASRRIGLNPSSSNQLDWMLIQSEKAVFFYDANQSIRLSDVPKENFIVLKKESSTNLVQLKSQLRVRGGKGYVEFVNKLLAGQLSIDNAVFTNKAYELKLFQSLPKMVAAIKGRNKEVGLSRLIAGYSWPWNSRHNPNDTKYREFDIIEDGVRLRWNTTNSDWVNSEGCENEVGCIHTTQGYDLNYSGIIFGHEISFDPVTNRIVVIRDNYHDTNGKKSTNDLDLHDYIINIYKTIMLRGIKGTYVYVCDPLLREYMAKFIPLAQSRRAEQTVVRALSPEKVKPYINSVPLYNLTAAAGDFSAVQQVEDVEWIALPTRFSPSEDLFACRVVGESMNKVIPNGSICLFRKYQAGTRNGKIMLVQLSDFSDPDTGAAFTVKEYRSRKIVSEEGYSHRAIALVSRSYNDRYQDIELTPEMAQDMHVMAEFEMVLGKIPY